MAARRWRQDRGERECRAVHASFFRLFPTAGDDLSLRNRCFTYRAIAMHSEPARLDVRPGIETFCAGAWVGGRLQMRVTGGRGIRHRLVSVAYVFTMESALFSLDRHIRIA